MNLTTSYLLLAILAAFPLSAREKTDVIVMKNGDKITCEIKSLRSNTLYISVDYILNTQSVDWSKVDHVYSKQLFIVTMQDGAVYTGALHSPEGAEQRQHIEVLEAPEKTVTLERTKVVNVDQTSHNIWHRLNGQIGAGYSYTKANESSQYNLNSDVNYAKSVGPLARATPQTSRPTRVRAQRRETKLHSPAVGCCAGTTGTTQALRISCKARCKEFRSRARLAEALGET